MWNDLFAALALVMVIEGLLPFISPRNYRQTMAQVVKMNDRNLRVIGFISMLIGLGMLYMVRQ